MKRLDRSDNHGPMTEQQTACLININIGCIETMMKRRQPAEEKADKH